MSTIQTILDSPANDSALIAAGTQGDRDAFGKIVARYQALICSVTFAATGNLAQSEDLAQETFLTAWRRLRDLRDPQKLRPWLCGIARHLCANAIRRRRTELAHLAAPVNSQTASPAPSPQEIAITHEEQAILWRGLEKIPAIYRQPLILFYRQDQSVRSVAESLGLSEDAVRQRLTRGRIYLRGQLQELVEHTLAQTKPTRAFTLGVVAALPVMATSAKAAAISSAAAKGSLVAQSAGAAALFTAWVAPAVGLLGAYIGVRAGIESTRTPGERRFVKRNARNMFIAAFTFNIILAGYIMVATSDRWQHHSLALTLTGIILPILWAVYLLAGILHWQRSARLLRIQEQKLHPELFSPDSGPALREYRSKRNFLGFPLYHIQRNSAWQEVSRAIGWIAIGENAFGLLFAAGGFAVAPISMGGIAIGILSLGGIGIGLSSVAGFAIAALAIGGLTIGYLAVGGAAMALRAAAGGIALSRDMARGGIVYALHANDAVAKAYFAHYAWLDVTQTLPRTLWTTILWLPFLLLGLYQLLRRLKKKPI